MACTHPGQKGHAPRPHPAQRIGNNASSSGPEHRRTVVRGTDSSAWSYGRRDVDRGLGPALATLQPDAEHLVRLHERVRGDAPPPGVLVDLDLEDVQPTPVGGQLDAEFRRWLDRQSDPDGIAGAVDLLDVHAGVAEAHPFADLTGPRRTVARGQATEKRLPPS